MHSTTPRLALFLPKFSLYGGAERFGYGLAESLAAEGLAVDFICTRQETDAPPGVKVINVRRPGLVKAGKMFWFAAACEYLRRRNGYDLTIGLGKSLHQDILRISGGPLLPFWRLSSRAWSRGPARSCKMLRRRGSPANWLTRWLEPRQLARATTVVAVSHMVRDHLLETYPSVNPEKIRLIYNRPDLDRFTPPAPERRDSLRREEGIDPQHTVIAFAGTNFALKGLATLLRALALLPASHVLHIAGGRHPGRWQSLAQELGVASRVRFLGRVSDMLSLYQRSDLFCLPSFYDACSNAVLEGLACGLPVVSTSSNGSSFFLPEHAVVRDPEDHEELAERIETSLSRHDPDTPFSWPEDVPAGLSAYKDLILEHLGR